jgi:hypothetical protein
MNVFPIAKAGFGLATPPIPELSPPAKGLFNKERISTLPANSPSLVMNGKSSRNAWLASFLTAAILATSWFGGAAAARAEAPNETILSPTVESVSAFKNGVAVIRAAFRVEKPGVYVWQRPPAAIHGTFWTESDLKVNVRSTVRMLPTPEGVPTAVPGLQEELAGRPVEVTLKATGAGQPATLRGRVWTPPPEGPVRSWDTNFASVVPGYAGWPYGYARGNVAVSSPLPAPGGFLVLEDEAGGRQYINPDTIASVSVHGAVEAKRPRQAAPILEFEIADAPKEPATVHVTYLARGLAWMPSYRLDLKDETKMKIRMGAVVRNELLDLHDAEVRLISGYPAVPFAHVNSPLWANDTLAGYFAQLSSQGGGGSGSVVTQQAFVNGNNSQGFGPNEGGAAADLKEENAGGVDMHYESIGRRTLAAGDSLAVDVGDADCAYERVIEWVIADKHDAGGRYRERNERKEDEDQPWDGIRFANPFRFPMTTGAAITTEGGDFRSQGTSYWMNPGQHATLRTSKALTLKTEVTENEDGAPKPVKADGVQYWQHTAQITLRMENFRDRPAKVIVRAEFRGDLGAADGKPESRVRPRVERGLNAPREVEWTTNVPAKGGQTLQFSYSYLAR